MSFAGSVLALDTTSEPAGILPKATQQKLWDAYKSAKECFRHPDYDPGVNQVVPTLSIKEFERPWTSPFTKALGAPECDFGRQPRLIIPEPIPVVKLDETYGERQQDVDAASTWFRDLTAYHRLSGDPLAAAQLKRGLIAWAQAKGLSKGIRVSWGSKPVDYQMMSVILSFVAAAAEIAETFTADERAVVGPWLNDLVKRAAASHWKDRADNKVYMRTYIALLWGLMAGDDKPVQDAIFTYKLAIHDMRPDGSWPIDSQRGGMGLLYNSAAASQVVMIALALKEARGIDLFGYEVDGRSVHTTVDWVVRSMKDPGSVNRIYAIRCTEGGDRFATIDAPVQQQFKEAGFLLAYAQRFPDRPSAKYILDYYKDQPALDSEKNGGAAACHFALKGRDVAFAPLVLPPEPPKLPTAKFQVRAREQEAYRRGDDFEVSSLLVVQVKGAKGGAGHFYFNVRGSYSKAVDGFVKLAFVLDEPLGKTVPPALDTCRAPTETFDDGTKHLVIAFDKKEGDFVAQQNIGCIVAALKGETAQIVNFLLDSFRDVAIGMVKTGDLDGVRHNGLKSFLRHVAQGEVSVSR